MTSCLPRRKKHRFENFSDDFAVWAFMDLKAAKLTSPDKSSNQEA